MDDIFTIKDMLENFRRQEDYWIFSFQRSMTGLLTHRPASLPKQLSYVSYDITIVSPSNKVFRYVVFMEEGGKG